MNQFVKRNPYQIVLAGVFLLISCFPLFAQEVIRSFDSNVQVSADGTLLVTETIEVRAEGKQIRRGIYRDFPLLFEDTDGKRKQVGFKLVSATRDGKPDGTREDRSNDKVRIYIGNPDYFLPTGTYTYRLSYETTRQIRFFENHEEVYWNATGNFWDFPIEKASAKVVLPEGAGATDTLVFTGRVGSTEQAASISTASGSRVVRFESNRILSPGEGMTIVVKLPKGSIAPPSDEQLSEWFWQDNKNQIIGLIVLALTTVYYFLTWWQVGRDPPGGAVVPRWDIPSNMSPAMVNYIYRKGLSGKGFDAISAAVLNLAVKGFVTLDKEEGGFLSSDTLIISPTGKQPDASMPVGEAAILSRVGTVGQTEFKVAKSNGSQVKKLQETFASAMEKEHRNRFYKHNLLAVLGGVALSVMGLAGLLYFGNFSEEVMAFMFIGSIMTAFFSSFVFAFVKSIFSGRNLIGKIFNLVFAGFFTFTLLSGGFVTGMEFLNVFSVETTLIVTVVGTIVLNVLFFFLLGAPTPLGRQRMDEIEGLKTYLSLAEKDRMNMSGVPDFSTEHYEKLLPYAVALGVEKPWSKAFDSWLAAAVAAGAVAAGYSPRWYRGRDFNSGSFSDTMGDFSDSMQSGFSGAMPVPKSSSSGFSGGSSGGGGGGGGGGGW